MKYNDQTPPALLNEYINRVEARWKQLNDLLLNIVTDGIKYLFYVNAGGCVAMITFIGTAEAIRQLNWPWYVLGLFFIGLLFVGMLNFTRYHAVDSILKGWQKDVGVFYDGNLEFHDMSNRDDERVAKSNWLLIFAYLSFACFIGGGGVGFFNYHELIKGQPKMMDKNLSVTQSISPDRKNHVPSKVPMPPQPQPPK